MTRETTAPRPGADEIRRVNQCIETRLEGNGKLAVAYPYPAGAYLFVLYREVFGSRFGNGPLPLSTEEAAIPLRLGKSSTDRGTARKASLNVLRALANSMTQWPDRYGEVNQSRTEARLVNWLKNTIPAIDPPFTPIITSSPGIPSPRPQPLLIHPTQRPTMDTMSEAGGVSLGPQSPNPYRHHRQVSITSVTTKMTEPAAAMDEPSSQGASPPKATSQQVYSNPQATHESQPPQMFAPQPLSVQQPLFMSMQTVGPSPVPPTAPTAAPPYLATQYTPMGLPGYYQYGYGQAAPLFPAHGHLPPSFPAQSSWTYQMHASLPPVYGPMPSMPPQQHFSYPQTLPLAGGQPVYVPQSMVRKSETEAPGPATPVQSRMTLPPAERQATSSAWAVPKGFNIAEWAQENRPTTPAKTSSTRQTVQPQHPLTNPTSVLSPIRYRFGTARMYPVSVKGAVSTQLDKLTSKGTPTFKTASEPDLFPFEDMSISGGPPPWGVVQIGNVREPKINRSSWPCS